MIISAFHCGLGTPLEFALGVALGLSRSGSKVAIVAFSPGYIPGLITQDRLSCSNGVSHCAALPLFERDITVSDVTAQTGVIDRDVSRRPVSVFYGVTNIQTTFDNTTSPTPELKKQIARNLQLLQEHFDLVIFVEALVYSDLSAAIGVISDYIFLVADGKKEAEVGADTFLTFQSKLVLCRGLLLLPKDVKRLGVKSFNFHLGEGSKLVGFLRRESRRLTSKDASSRVLSLMNLPRVGCRS